MQLTTESSEEFPGAVAPGPSFDDAVWRLIRVIQFRDRDRICCAGLTVSQGHALELIAQEPGMRLTTLAARLRLDKSNATRIAAGLEELGYVRRARDVTDGRAMTLALTRRGVRAHRDLRGLLGEDNARATAGLSAGEQRSVTQVLLRLADLLEGREQVPLEGCTRSCSPEATS